MLTKTTTHRQRYWLAHVKAAELSDGTIAEYAQAHDVRVKSLYQWKSKLIKLKLYSPVTSVSASEFVPLNLSPAQTPLQFDKPVHADRSGCTVTLANGSKIDFHGKLSPGVIQSIMTTASRVH